MRARTRAAVAEVKVEAPLPAPPEKPAVRTVVVESRAVPTRSHPPEGLGGFSPEKEWGGDVESRRPDFGKPLILLSSNLVLEKSDPMNWTLKQRVLVTSGPNQGKHRWNDHGFYGLPGQALTKVMELRLEEELGEGATDVHRALQAMRDVERGMRQAVLDVERRQLRRRVLEEAMDEVREEASKARLQKLLKDMGEE